MSRTKKHSRGPFAQAHIEVWALTLVLLLDPRYWELKLTGNPDGKMFHDWIVDLGPFRILWQGGDKLDASA